MISIGRRVSGRAVQVRKRLGRGTRRGEAACEDTTLREHRRYKVARRSGGHNHPEP